MASNYFNFSPSSGSGNGNVRVWPQLNANETHSDRVATLTVTNGSVTRNITITQFGIPTITLVSGSTSVPATGGTLTYTIYTRYPFGFQNKPDWITISDSNGRYYGDSSTYPANYATTGVTFTITVASYDRTDTDRSTEDYLFAFRFKTSASASSWDSHTTAINITQAAKEDDQAYLNVTPASANFEWDGGSVVFNIDASSSNWSFSNGANGIFDATRSGNTLTVSTKSNNTTTAKRTGTITFAIGTITKTVSLSQWSMPRISLNSGSDLAPVAMAGGTRYVNVTSDYPWWFLPLPIEDYITITDYQSNVQNLSSLNPHIAINSNNTFNFTWGRNETEAIRSDYFYLGYIDLDGEVQVLSRNTVSFSQLDTAEAVHNVDIPDGLSVSAGGGIRKVTVSSDDDWWFIDVPSWITVYDADGNILVVNDASGKQSSDDGNQKTFYLHFDAFDGTGTRTYRPTIEYAGGTAQAISTFTQYDETVAPYIQLDGYEVPYYRSVKSVLVSCDYDWYWTTIPSYVRIVDENNMPAEYTSTSPNTTDKFTGAKTYYWIFEENTGSRRTVTPSINYGSWNGSSFVEIATVSRYAYVQFGPYEITPTSYEDTMPYATQTSFTFSLATTPWTYTAPSWMTVTADTDSHYGTAYIAIPYNDGIQRTGDIEITSGGNTLYFTYTQGGSLALGPDPNAWNISATDTAYKTVTVRMLESWNHTVNNNWIHINDYNHSSGEGTLVFYLDANTSTDDRDGTITVYDSENTYTIWITQYGTDEQQDVFTISNASISEVSTGQQTLSTVITATGGYTATTTESWIHRIDGWSTSSSNATTIYFYCDRYTDTTQNRSGYITLTRNSDGAVRTILVTQYKDWEFVATESNVNITYRADGSKYSSSTNPSYISNYAFRMLNASGNAVSWISSSGYSATSSYTTLNFGVASNTTGSSRSATVYPWLYNNKTGQYDRMFNAPYTIIQYSS